MNIRIPYESIGDLGEVEFVSFILDRDNNSIFRRDFGRISDPWFFNKSKNHVIIEPSLYESCDTVIFYPYRRNKGWGDKVKIHKNDKKFSIANASLEFLKNSEKKGDVNLLKKWLKRGLQIPLKEDAKGEKNLIYFTAFANQEYLKLLRLLLKGLKAQPFKNFDILFITDKKTKKELVKIRDLNAFNVDYHILKTINDPVYASMQKLKIYQYPKIKDYKKILFLDMDILVLGDMTKIFEEKIRSNILYSGIQRYNLDIHNSVYHTIRDYSKEQLEKFERLGIFPFNAGQFLFLNTSTMRKHFKNIDEFTQKWDGRFFFEQSYLNTYFNTLQITDIFKFKEQFGFISINIKDTEYKPNENTVIVHFMGSIAEPNGKLNFVKQHYSDFFNKV